MVLNNMEHKFKVGDRVRVIKISDNSIPTSCQIGDVGTIDFCGNGNVYAVKLDKLVQKNPTGPTCTTAVEQWLEYENQLITCE